MGFKQKYPIIKDYLTKGSRKRPGNNIKVRFIVAHDTGNPGSTAKGNINYYRNTEDKAPASAHLFVDDKEIRECIPALTGKPERAYHVIYNVTTDNARYGDDANDAAIGVELCWGGKINNKEAYKRYVWVHAYLCYVFKLNPRTDIVGHDMLDPKRKIDPTHALKDMGKTFKQFIEDVVAEYKACIGGEEPKVQPASKKKGKTYKVVAGDTLWSIAQRFGTTVARLKALNPDVDVNALRIGSVLLIEPANQKPSYPGRLIKRGDRGNEVKMIQQAIGIKADGIFGSQTEKAVKEFQRRHGLAVDGIVGKQTWAALF